MIRDVSQGPSTDTGVKDRDQEMKEKGKEYADRKRKAVDCDLMPGDKVYIKNMTKENKLSLNYDTTTHTVEKKMLREMSKFETMRPAKPIKEMSQNI